MKNSGFTLIEVVTTMLIASILLAGIYVMVWNQQRAYSEQGKVVESLRNARITLNYMTKELRMAGFKGPGSSFTGVQVAQKTSIRVLDDRDQNGSTSGAFEDITYAYDPDTMKLLKNGKAFMNEVTDFSLNYTMADGTQTNNPTDLTAIRKISVAVAIRSKDANFKGQHKITTLTSDIVPRNMGI